MALANDRTLLQGPSIQELRLPSSLELFGYMGYSSTLLRDGESSDSHGTYSSSLLSFHSGPSNSYSCADNMLGAVNSPPRESLSVVASQQPWACFDTAVPSFDGHLNLDHQEECAAWIDAMDRIYRPDIERGTADSRLIQEKDCFEVGSGKKRRGQDRFGFIYSGAAAFDDGLGESIGQTTVLQKRSSTCGNTKRTKDKSTSPSKDPQILGVFLSMQVLATDEFWPAQGGETPDVGQVKEAIDAILSSHRDRNSQLRL
ncbi:hypothetical protein B296_00051901 [Ensete ventricosum]|uniref:Uncharacterized protein n=1 Tax=Ensete ventricosum TaxID=4639 RepID=A0A426XBA5_ENSVE|nr:hypothetical protein B296_00051901 [Ensete ventricosum]